MIINTLTTTNQSISNKIAADLSGVPLFASESGDKMAGGDDSYSEGLYALFAPLPLRSILAATPKYFKTMAEETKVTEKVYCYDHPAAYRQDNTPAMLAAMLGNNKSNPLEAAALMNGGMGGQWNNPFIYLVWMMFANRFFGNGEWGSGQNAQNVETQNQLQAIRSQMQDNQNSNLLMDAVKGNAAAIGQLASNLNCDFNALNSAICDVRGGIDKLAGQVGFSSERVINAVQSGNASVVQALQNCCCQTQTSIASLKSDLLLQNCKDTGELRGGQRDLGQAITQGFANTAYETQKQTCDIINAGNANTQRIIDTLNCHWQQDLQQRYNDARLELSQQRQNAELIAALRTTTTATA